MRYIIDYTNNICILILESTQPCIPVGKFLHFTRINIQGYLFFYILTVDVTYIKRAVADHSRSNDDPWIIELQ